MDNGHQVIKTVTKKGFVSLNCGTYDARQALDSLMNVSKKGPRTPKAVSETKDVGISISLESGVRQFYVAQAQRRNQTVSAFLSTILSEKAKSVTQEIEEDLQRKIKELQVQKYKEIDVEFA